MKLEAGFDLGGRPPASEVSPMGNHLGASRTGPTSRTVGHIHGEDEL